MCALNRLSFCIQPKAKWFGLKQLLGVFFLTVFLNWVSLLSVLAWIISSYFSPVLCVLQASFSHHQISKIE
jgi:hypothetical protein